MGMAGLGVMELRVTELRDQVEELRVTGLRDAVVGLGQRWSWR